MRRAPPARQYAQPVHRDEEALTVLEERWEFDVGRVQFRPNANETDTVPEGFAGPGDVGRYLDHDRFHQCQVNRSFVFAESVQGGLADFFRPWVPGLRRAELAAQPTPYPLREKRGPANDPQLPIDRQAGDDRLRLTDRADQAAQTASRVVLSSTSAKSGSHHMAAILP